MRYQDFSKAWRFQYGPGGAGTKADKTWTEVDLPHDASISLPRTADAVGGGSNAFYPGAVCWYEKELELTEAESGKSVMLEVQGAYMNAVVLVNRHIAGRRPYGYSAFHCDLTPWLVPGKNLVRIEVNNGGLANTRWYAGSGLYRPVGLLVGDAVRIEPWSLQVTTPELGPEEAKVQACLSVRNDRSEPVNARVRFEVRKISSGESAGGADGEDAVLGPIVGEGEAQIDLPAGAATMVATTLGVRDILPWSPEQPALYALRAAVMGSDPVTGSDPGSFDEEAARFGFRTVSVDAVNGFQLNGQTRKLKGGCVHHDCGLLGAAAFARAEERKVELLKASGFDAVRCAHNPPSPAFLDACDRLGMLVIDEAFDCWRHGKNPGDYSLWFEEWWGRDLMDMVRRDFNHPSVVMWSTGNEIIERDGRSNAAELAERMAEIVRSLDKTRPVTNALCDLWEERKPEDPPEFFRSRFMEKTAGFSAPLDVVGWNYLLHWYDQAADMYPGRVICGTETFPKDAFDYWAAVEAHPNIIGDFVWTSLDYLGEAGIGHVKHHESDPFLMPFPWHHANCGDIDICGNKRPQSHYRDCVWGIATAPYIAVHAPERYGKTAILSPWGWPEVSANWTWAGWEEKPCVVDVYSTADEVALVCNGKELGRKPAGRAHKHLASFEVTYVPGKLEAVAYCDGVETARTVLETAGPAASIRLTADRTQLNDGAGDLSFVQVALLDAQGRLATQAENRLHFTVHGAGQLLAVGNGDPASEEAFVGTTRKAWRGLATAVVLGGAAGKATLTVTGEGLVPAAVEVEIG
jgi:beta-galactosidase